jgi:hypothetical protein
VQSFNKWFFSQFVSPVEEETDEEVKTEKKRRRRKQKYINRKKRAIAQAKTRR